MHGDQNYDFQEQSDSNEQMAKKNEDGDLESHSGGKMAAQQENEDQPKKRHRRTANEINRRFVCYCGKAYGSEGSLNQHKKNKGHYAQDQMNLSNYGNVSMKDANQSIDEAQSKYGSGDKPLNQSDMNQLDHETSRKMIDSNDNSQFKEDHDY